MKRRLARECAFKALFMVDVGKNDPEKALCYTLESESLFSREQLFSGELFRGVLHNKEDLDQLLSHYLVNWQLHRLAATVRNILRLALFEMLYDHDIPPAVSINEAIELAKNYHDDEAARFINGILDNIFKAAERD